MNLAKLNLNLLLSLQALLTEASVTAAAQRLHITQSAMSKSLAQLRELFNDPLLVRVDNSTQPTLLAKELRQRVDAVLRDIEQMLQHAEFDPARCEHSFTLVASDFEAQYMLPGIFKRLYGLAPGISLRVMHLDEQVVPGLLNGRIDLSLSTLDNLPPQLRRRLIYTDPLVCLMSARHPLAVEPLTLDGYCAYPHVVNSAERGRQINDLLAAQGRYRRIRLEVPLYQAALRLISDGDSLVTVPAQVARKLLPDFDLHQAELPFPAPLLEHGLVWPERLDSQASHRWLRETIADEILHFMAGSGNADVRCGA